MNDNIEIQHEPLRETLNVIEEDINVIEEILLKVVKANGSLDEGKWKSTEKNKMDQEYIPYMNKISINVPKALRKHLNLLRESVNIYENKESELIEEIDKELDDFQVETLG